MKEREYLVRIGEPAGGKTPATAADHFQDHPRRDPAVEHMAPTSTEFHGQRRYRRDLPPGPGRAIEGASRSPSTSRSAPLPPSARSGAPYAPAKAIAGARFRRRYPTPPGDRYRGDRADPAPAAAAQAAALVEPWRQAS